MLERSRIRVGYRARRAINALEARVETLSWSGPNHAVGGNVSRCLVTVTKSREAAAPFCCGDDVTW